MARTASRSLKGSARVYITVSGGTPAEPGMPRVATPLPALTQKTVGVAVIAAFELDDEVAAR